MDCSSKGEQSCKAGFGVAATNGENAVNVIFGTKVSAGTVVAVEDDGVMEGDSVCVVEDGISFGVLLNTTDVAGIPSLTGTQENKKNIILRRVKFWIKYMVRIIKR